ncbi:unnamed protein product, partial [Linum tenue]
EEILTVHCQSKDDDLGGHAVAVGATYHWDFGTNLLGGTLFWCKLAIEDKRIFFVAYDDDSREPGFGSWAACDDRLYGMPQDRLPFLKALWT